MKKYLKVLTLAVLLTNLNATEVYTVDDLIVQALQHSPDLHLSANDYAASQSRLKQANAGYLPQVDLSLSGGKGGKSNIPLNPDKMLNDTLLSGSLSLQQLVYDFGKTNSISNNVKYESEGFANTYEQLISDKKRDVKSAYFNVLQKIALIKVNQENLKLNKAQLYRSQKYFEAGIRTKIDVSDARVELIKSKLNLNKSQYNLKLAYAFLDKNIGYEKIHNDYQVYTKDLDLTNLYSSIKNYSLTLDESVIFAYKNRYEIKKQQSLLEVAKADVMGATAEYYPSLYFNAKYTKQHLDTYKTTVPKDQWQALLNLDVNLYKGGASDANREEKNINLQKASTNIAYTKLLIKTEVTEAYINVEKAKDSVELSQSLLEVSHEKFEQASKRYEHGLSDFIELQQARQGYIDAMSSLIVDYYSYYDSVAHLDNAIGR